MKAVRILGSSLARGNEDEVLIEEELTLYLLSRYQNADLTKTEALTYRPPADNIVRKSRPEFAHSRSPSPLQPFFIGLTLANPPLDNLITQ